MTISTIIDVRPNQVYGSPPSSNSDHLGAKEAFDFINSQVDNIGDWQDITIDYGEGATVVATGRITSLESVRPNPVRIGEYSVDIEIPTSGTEDAWNMTGPTHQSTFINEFPGTKIRNIFQSSGAAFQDFSEEFSFSLGEDRGYEYEHSLSIQMLSGQHLSQDPIQTAKEVAQAIFFVAPSDAPAFGFIDDQFSGFYRDSAEPTIDDITKSGVKYFSETYDLENLNCSFSKRVTLNHELQDDYTVDVTHSMTMGEDGYVNVSENGNIKGTINKPVPERYIDVTGAMESEIAKAKARCDAFYGNYLTAGMLDPDYKGTRDGDGANNSDTLFAQAVSVGRSLEPNIGEASYTVAFTNNKHTYETNGIHEYTQNVTEGRDGIVSISLDGKLTKYYRNKLNDYTWKTSIYDQLSTNFAGEGKTFLQKAQETYSYYKTKQKRSYKERAKTNLPVTAYKGGLVDPSIVLVTSSVSIPKYGSAVEYSNQYTDDPSILKPGSPLYDTHNFRKFSVSTNDQMMKPMNSAYTIAGKRYQIIHDATQTEMGSRSFNIEGPTNAGNPSLANTITNPAAWNIGPKLEAIKDEVSQIMANIIADTKIKGTGGSFIGDVFIQDVSFSIDSKGNFSASGNIPFIALGGEKYNTVGRVI